MDSEYLKEKIKEELKKIKKFESDLRLRRLQDLRNTVKDLWMVLDAIDFQTMQRLSGLVEDEIFDLTGA